MRFPCVVLFVFSGVRFNGIVVVVVLGCFVCVFAVCACLVVGLFSVLVSLRVLC